jgi:hypothetical protein
MPRLLNSILRSACGVPKVAHAVVIFLNTLILALDDCPDVWGQTFFYLLFIVFFRLVFSSFPFPSILRYWLMLSDCQTVENISLNI